MDVGVSKDDDILMGLYRKGWLQFDMEQESYSMHSVFAQFIYEKYIPRVEKHWGLIETCQRSLEIPESGAILECKQYIPFAENIFEKIDVGRFMKPVGLISNLSVLLQYIAGYKKAESLLKKVVKMKKKTS